MHRHFAPRRNAPYHHNPVVRPRQRRKYHESLTSSLSDRFPAKTIGQAPAGGWFTAMKALPLRRLSAARNMIGR
jgi:hypothetical protein